MVTEGCVIEGTVDFSVVFAGVTIEEGAVVRDSIIMPGSVIRKGAVVDYAIVAEQTIIGENAVVGARPEGMEDISGWGVTVIGSWRSHWGRRAYCAKSHGGNGHCR